MDGRVGDVGRVVPAPVRGVGPGRRPTTPIAASQGLERVAVSADSTLPPDARKGRGRWTRPPADRCRRERRRRRESCVVSMGVAGATRAAGPEYARPRGRGRASHGTRRPGRTRSRRVRPGRSCWGSGAAWWTPRSRRSRPRRERCRASCGAAACAPAWLSVRSRCRRRPTRRRPGSARGSRTAGRSDDGRFELESHSGRSGSFLTSLKISASSSWSRVSFSSSSARQVVEDVAVVVE